MKNQMQDQTINHKAGDIMKRLTKEQANVIGAYTMVLCGTFSDLHEAVEKKLGRPVWTHQFADKEMVAKNKWFGTHFDGRSDILPESVEKWAGLLPHRNVSVMNSAKGFEQSLSSLNDHGSTFQEIAHLIHDHL